MSNIFDLELYKLLKAESVSYFDKLQSIWLQKFVLVGAVIAFLAATLEKLPEYSESIIAPAVAVAVPLLSALLDAKIMEFSLHGRLISRFISSRYQEAGGVAQWEATLWGRSPDSLDQLLSRSRSLTTALTAVIPTIGLTLLSALVLGVLVGPVWLFMSLGLFTGLAYAVVATKLWDIVLDRT